MIILGIDPGTATTGYGVIENQKDFDHPKALDFGCIRTSSEFPNPMMRLTPWERQFVALEVSEKAILAPNPKGY